MKRTIKARPIYFVSNINLAKVGIAPIMPI